MTDDLESTTTDRPGSDPSAAAAEGTSPGPEPAPDIPASQVETPPALPRKSRTRWAVALGAIATIVAASALVISLFTGKAADAVVLGYVPEDSVIYGEVRLDLPGDQRANLGEFLSKFPGFADQSTLDTKLDEVLDRLIGGVSGGSQSYSADIKPWFAGQLAFSVGPLPDSSALSGPDPAALRDARFLVLASVKDEGAARAWFESAIAETGATTSTETYGGTSVTLVAGKGGPQGAWALLGEKVVAVGDLASVRAAVDTGGASGFAAKPEPQAALAATSGDHVGFVYIALRELVEWSGGMAGSDLAGALPVDALLGLVPGWAALAVRVEGDALVLEAITPNPEAAAGQDGSRTSAVADHVPSSAVVLAISHDYGEGILGTLDDYRSDPELKPLIDSVDQAIALLGGPDAAIGWIGDVGVTVIRADEGFEAGLVIIPTDGAAAGRLFGILRGLVSLGGASMGVTVRDEAYAGTTITVVDLGDVGDLVGLAGIPSEMPGTGALPTGRVELAYALTDQVVIIGSGPGFVRHVLDTTVATSIASNERYKALAGRIAGGVGVAFADLSAIRELIESGLAGGDPVARASYEQEVKPFLSPFDALIGSRSVEGGLSRSTIIVTVK